MSLLRRAVVVEFKVGDKVLLNNKNKTGWERRNWANEGGHKIDPTKLLVVKWATDRSTTFENEAYIHPTIKFTLVEEQ